SPRTPPKRVRIATSIARAVGTVVSRRTAGPPRDQSQDAANDPEASQAAQRDDRSGRKLDTTPQHRTHPILLRVAGSCLCSSSAEDPARVDKRGEAPAGWRLVHHHEFRSATITRPEGISIVGYSLRGRLLVL